jgi:hypothetical protein
MRGPCGLQDTLATVLQHEISVWLAVAFTASAQAGAASPPKEDLLGIHLHLHVHHRHAILLLPALLGRSVYGACAAGFAQNVQCSERSFCDVDRSQYSRRPIGH